MVPGGESWLLFSDVEEILISEYGYDDYYSSGYVRIDETLFRGIRLESIIGSPPKKTKKTGELGCPI